MSVVLGRLQRTRENRALVEHDREIAFGNSGASRTRAKRADEREPMTVLEPCLSDDVALKSGCSIVEAVRTSADCATASTDDVSEDLAGRNDAAGLRSRSSRTVCTGTVVEELDCALLLAGTIEAVRSAGVSRSVRDRDTCIESA